MSSSRTAGLLTVALSMLTAGGLQAQGKSPDLTDAEVAHVAVTANKIDIDQGKLAETRASSAEVKEFAATMVRDHSAVNAKAAALAKELSVTPRDNATSQSLLKGAAEARAPMEKLSGKEFDRAYITREIAYHQAVIDALDKVLIPTTENPQLKKLLVDVRPNFVAHLEYAKKVNSKVVAAR